MEILNILKVLLRKKWIILACGLVAAIVAFLFTLDEKKKFESTAQLATGFTSEENIRLAQTGFNPAQIDVKFNNAIEDLSSSRVLSLVAYDLMLHDLQETPPFRDIPVEQVQPIYAKTSKLEIITVLKNARDSVNTLSPAVPRQEAALKLLDLYGYSIYSLKYLLEAKRFERTDYVNITAISQNPNLSAFAANALCREFQRFNASVRREFSTESMVALDSVVGEKKELLDQKIAAKTAYINDSMTSSLDPSVLGASQLSQISTIESSRASAIAKKSSLEYQINQYNQQLRELSSGAGTNPTQNSEYAALRKRYNQLYEQYVDGGSNDPALEKQLNDLQQQMKDKTPSTVASTNPDQLNALRNNLIQSKTNAEADLAEANTQINYFNGKLAQLQSGLGSASTPKISARLEQLESEINAAQNEYDNANSRLNLASTLGQVSPVSFKQTLFAQPSTEPVKSKRWLIVAFAGLAAISLVAMIYIFRELFDSSIKTSAQFTRLTNGLPLLGTVNMVNFDRMGVKDQVVALTEDSSVKNRTNKFRELLRKIRFELQSRDQRVILFTSTEPQQGKTTLCQALAYSLSLSSKRVLILDTNFCNNDITVYNEATPVLESFQGNPFGLNGKGNLEKLVSHTAIEGVDIIGCAGGDYSPSEVLKNDHLLQHLPELLQHYDYIFMEGAPLNGYTDSKELSSYSDGVIAIFSATTQIKQSDKTSIEFLKNLNGKFLGAVLNKVDEENISQ